jgi:hypothetical protein
MSGLAESCATVNDKATPMGLTGDSGGAFLPAGCAQASAKTEQVAASRNSEFGMKMMVEVDESCGGALAS